MFLILNHGCPNWCLEHNMAFSKQEMELFPPFQAFDEKILLQSLSNFYQGLENWFPKEEMEFSKQEMDIFLLLPGLWSKNSFYTLHNVFDFFLGLQKWFIKQEMDFST